MFLAQHLVTVLPQDSRRGVFWSNCLPPLQERG